MGDKISSKKIALKANVDCIPGVNQEIKNLNQAFKVANDIGYPVMIKASAGGGGKGMRYLMKKEDLKELKNLQKMKLKMLSVMIEFLLKSI